MSCKNRKTDLQGNFLNYTCKNTRFSTDINKGFSHGSLSTTKGSVFEKPILEIDRNHYTLWLEHVIDNDDNNNIFWLMWYDEKGCPTISMSAVFSKNELAEIIRKLTLFIP